MKPLGDLIKPFDASYGFWVPYKVPLGSPLDPYTTLVGLKAKALACLLRPMGVL